MEGSALIVLLLLLFVIAAAAYSLARRGVHGELETLRIRLSLTETTWQEKGLMILLTGKKGGAPLTFAGRPWGPLSVRVPIPAALPLGLSLRPQGKAAHLRGMEDIQVGLPDLDAHFQVQGEQPAATIRYLREGRAQQALRSLVAADTQAAVTHGEVRLTVADPEAPSQIERTIQLAHRIAWELAEATGSPIAPAQSPEPGSPSQQSSSEKPFVTAVTEGGLIRPRFSPAYLANIQRVHRTRKMLLRGLYAVSAAWITVLTMDRYFEASILFVEMPRRHPAWNPLFILSFMVIVGLRLWLRRCASCGSPIGEGYGVTRLMSTQTITCTNCGIDLQ